MNLFKGFAAKNRVHLTAFGGGTGGLFVSYAFNPGGSEG